MITDDELRQLFPKLPQPQRLTYIPLLEAAMNEFGIKTKLRRAAFIGQIGHESAQLTRFVENLNYGAQGLLKTFPKRFPVAAKANAIERQPEKIANFVYANILGNGPEASGDGFRYRGRGAIQLTGRENYRIFGKVLGLDLEGNPDLAAAPEVAFRTAGAFWKSKGCNELADQLVNPLAVDAKFKEITKKINAKMLGLKERQALFEKANLVLKEEAAAPAAPATRGATRGIATSSDAIPAVQERSVPANLSRGIDPGEEAADAGSSRKSGAKKAAKKPVKKAAKKAAAKKSGSKKAATKKGPAKKSSSKKGAAKKSGRNRQD